MTSTAPVLAAPAIPGLAAEQPPWQRWALVLAVHLGGMKVATVLAVAGAVVGEFIASDKGLGYLMIQVQTSLDTPAVFMAVLLITGLGVLLYLLVLLLERLFITQDARLQ